MSSNTKKGKRKTSKGAGSGDVNTSEGLSDSQSQVTDASSDGDKPLLKRDSFICSTGHNDHLREDYETDETFLVGRKVLHHRRFPSDVSSIESRSLISYSIDAGSLSRASSLDFPPTPTPSMTGTLERKHLQTVPEEGESRSHLYRFSPLDLDLDKGHKRKDSDSLSQLATPKEHKRKFGVLGRFRSMDERSYRGSSQDLGSSRANSDTWDAETLSVYSSASQSTRVMDVYEPYALLEDELMSGQRKLKKQQSTTSLQSLRNAEGRLLVARGSVVHPVGPFNEPTETPDESSSYASVFDPTVGRARLIRRDSVIHPPTNTSSGPTLEELSLERRNSIIRPLKLEPEPEPPVAAPVKLYRRNSVTHVYPENLGEDVTDLMATLMPSSNGSALMDKNSANEPLQRLPRPLWINERFENPWRTLEKPGFLGSLKCKLSSDQSKIPRIEKLNKTLPIITPKFDDHPPGKGIRVTWLGHSTVLVQMEGITYITDPMFSERASPVQFMGLKRYRDAPCTVYDLPPIDAVLISHNHYDHLDYNTVVLINARFGPRTRWFVPLGLLPWMRSVGCEDIIEMSWWEESSFPLARHVAVKFTPAQHWCKRTPTDENKVLWGSWCVLGRNHRFFFAGDTGYCDVFKVIGREYGPFDLAAIPIGAYEPRWFMKSQYVDPDEAVLIHEDIRAKQSIGIHWGTFNLAHEHYLDPPKRLQIALSRRKLPPHSFFTLRHGDTKLVSGV